MDDQQQYLWENDASLMRQRPGYMEKLELETFRMYQEEGLTAEQAYPPGFDDAKRQRYAEFLKNPR